MLSGTDVRRATEILQSAKAVRCVCHKNPDGDAIGSLLGMSRLLASYLSVPVTTHCVDPVPETFYYLQGVHTVRPEISMQEGDVLVFLDSAEPHLTNYHETHPQFFDGTYESINIDHHPSNPKFGSVNMIVPDAASTCEIVVALADQVGMTIDSETATALLTGVYTDTGSLLHSNTTPQVYRTVARLLRAGARHNAVVKHVFRSAKISTLRLWGRVLEHISVTDEGGAISALREEDFRATGAEYSELTGAIDYVNAVPGMRFSLILSERDGKVKGSLRTLRDDVDVAEMAQKFDGGGHKKAAGFALDGKLQAETRWKVVKN